METASSAASAMDAMYRHQRHFYDITRKYYLLGRDDMIAELKPPAGGSVLEVGCGTGRNLVQAGKLHPGVRLFGVDVSQVMLETAKVSLGRAGLDTAASLAQADATDFKPEVLFGLKSFDRVFVSYALSMIGPWRRALACAAAAVAPGGELHVVDFGPPSGMPGVFRAPLLRWLDLFDVTPRDDLPAMFEQQAATLGATVKCRGHRFGYAWIGVMRFAG